MVGQIPGNAFLEVCAERAAAWQPDPARVQAIIDARIERARLAFERDLRTGGFKRPGRGKK